MADVKKKLMSEASSSNSSSTGAGGGDNRGESIVVDVGRRKSSCGYCKSGARTSISHGLWAHSLTVDDYQGLLDRGWRRSGCFLYKPEMERTCCPSYTIRLKASTFVPSKEQLRVSKRMQRFLDASLNAEKSDKHTEPSSSRDSRNFSHEATTSSAPMDFLVDNSEPKNTPEQFIQYLSDQIDRVLHECIERGELPCHVQLPQASVKSVVQAKRKLLVEGSQDLLYSSNISFQVAAAIRRANKNCPKPSAHSPEENNLAAELTPKTIAEKLSSYLNLSAEAFGFSVKACNGHINFYSTAKLAPSNSVIEKVAASKDSATVSGGNDSCLKKFCGQNQAAKRQSLEIRLERSSFDPEEYALYRRYQIKVHNDAPDQVTESSYRRFLVDSPLVFVPSTGNGTAPPCGFGSFHQQYVINGRLVAVGVIDILPKCLSSKYLFWDPDLAFLSLGKYSALQEISWVRENESHCPSLQYYYLGYYIHSCSKMRYKAAYRPSELLCPLRYQWVSFDIAKPLLDRKPYVVLSNFPMLQIEEPSASTLFENHTDLQNEDPCQEESNDVPIDEDEEMSELDFDDSEDESGPETTNLTLEIESGNVSNIMIGLKGTRLKYKDIQQAFGHPERKYLEAQLHRYMKAVGVDLSERMVYSLG